LAHIDRNHVNRRSTGRKTGAPGVAAAADDVRSPNSHDNALGICPPSRPPSIGETQPGNEITVGRAGRYPDCQRRANHHLHVMVLVTVWFDGSCPLCSREIALMRRLDWRGAVAFVDAADPEQVCPTDRRAFLERLRARESDGPLLSGAAAFAAMWRAIPPLRPLGLLVRHHVALAILEWLYDLFLRVRPASPALRASRTTS
jgi:predicted DCC family thiol-disulfide oxidoreductase YuxK